MPASPEPLLIRATAENFSEEAYLALNPDVAEAVRHGKLPSGRRHFEAFGLKEGRMLRTTGRMSELRQRKMARLQSSLRNDMKFELADGKPNYLAPDLRMAACVADANKVHSNSYDGNVIALIGKYADGLILDCGAGQRDVYYENVVNFETEPYDTTDVIGTGEELPFKDNAFDAVISVAVLEHVRDPFRCASEIARVLKPGGELYCAVSFLQPYHGSPHHYFNMTHEGLPLLFQDRLTIASITTPDSTHPIFGLSSILRGWLSSLPNETRDQFLEMKVRDLTESPNLQVQQPFCRELATEKRLELASATVLTAKKSD